MKKQKAVVVVTRPEPKSDGPSPALNDILTASAEIRDYDDKNLLFRPPVFRPIEVPAEIFNTDMKRQRFFVAVHEVGHALTSMMVCRPVQCLTVTEINGSVRGGANTEDAHGEDAALVDLGGIAAEQLVIGSGDCHSGATIDIKNARKNLRDDRVREGMIDSVLQASQT